MDSDGIGKFPFGDGRELFDSTLKYSSQETPSNAWGLKFSRPIFW